MPALRMALAGLALGLGLTACGGAVECRVSCGSSDATVVRSFPSCRSLRDEIDRRSSSGQMSACELDALQACEKQNCSGVPL